MTLKYGEVFLVNCDHYCLHPVGLSGVPSIEGVSPDSLFTQAPAPVSSNPDSPMAAVLFS